MHSERQISPKTKTYFIDSPSHQFSPWRKDGKPHGSRPHEAAASYLYKQNNGVCATNIVQIQVLICTSIGNIGKFPYWKRNPCLLGIRWACFYETIAGRSLTARIWQSQSVFTVMAIPAMRTQQLDDPTQAIWLECLQHIARARSCLERWSWRGCGNGPSSLPSLCNQYQHGFCTIADEFGTR